MTHIFDTEKWARTIPCFRQRAARPNTARQNWHIGSPAETTAATSQEQIYPEGAKHLKNTSNLALCLFNFTALLQKQTCHGSGHHTAQEKRWCFLSCTSLHSENEKYLWSHSHDKFQIGISLCQLLPRQLSHSTGTNPKSWADTCGCGAQYSCLNCCSSTVGADT